MKEYSTFRGHVIHYIDMILHVVLISKVLVLHFPFYIGNNRIRDDVLTKLKVTGGGIDFK